MKKIFYVLIIVLLSFTVYAEDNFTYTIKDNSSNMFKMDDYVVDTFFGDFTPTSVTFVYGEDLLTINENGMRYKGKLAKDEGEAYRMWIRYYEENCSVEALAEDGSICKTYGHSWGEPNTYNNILAQTRTCKFCGVVQILRGHKWVNIIKEKVK